MNKNLKNEKGITLIALVITIIVLLILAAVSIATLTGENGILTKASEAVMENAHAEVYETLLLETQTYRIETEKGVVNTDLSSYFKGKGILKEDNIVNVEKLLEKKAKYGNGTDGATDIYKLELDEESVKERYDIVYYGADAIGVILGEIELTSKGDVSDNSIFTFADNAKTILTGVKPEYVEEVFIKGEEGTFYGIIDENGDKVDEISIPEGVVEIGDSAFERYGRFIINVPASVRVLGNKAFNLTQGLVNIEGKYSEKQFDSVGENALDCEEVKYLDCSKFFEYEDEAKTILKGIKSEYVVKTREPEIPDEVKADGIYAIVDDVTGDEINKIVIPEGVTTISDEAFLGFKNLVVYIPSSVMTIGEYGFCYCDTVYIEGKTSKSEFTTLGYCALDYVGRISYLGNY